MNSVSKVTARTLIYCGEGRAFGNDPNGGHQAGDEKLDLQNVDLVTRILLNGGYRVAKFTSRESADERKSIIERIRSGNIQVLAAIRCLDEGVNIPPRARRPLSWLALRTRDNLSSGGVGYSSGALERSQLRYRTFCLCRHQILPRMNSRGKC